MSAMRVLGVCAALLFALASAASADDASGRTPMFETDTFATSAGELTITFVGHGTLMFALGEKIIHVDPVSREADYRTMPKTDLILITHDHGDHLDPAAIEAVRQPGTAILAPAKCASRVPGATPMANGETKTVAGLKVEATPAYNLDHMRSPGRPYHPRGEGNGYVITFGVTRVYVAGDTENIPEMKALEHIDIAFLPMNLPYTMTPEMVADAARAFRPKVLYPYHYGQTDAAQLVTLLADEPDIEVRVRQMQ